MRGARGGSAHRARNDDAATAITNSKIHSKIGGGDGEIDFSVGAYSAMHAPNVAIMWLVMGSGTEEGERMKR